VSQTAMVLNLVRTLADSGVAVLLISHNLVDVFKVADHVAVLYLGHVVTVTPTAQLDTQRAVELITTGSLADAAVGNGKDAR
jgi:D-xylose transport system ATP-binding protein